MNQLPPNLALWPIPPRHSKAQLPYMGTSLTIKCPLPYDRHRAPGVDILKASRRRRFLMSKGPLYMPHRQRPTGCFHQRQGGLAFRATSGPAVRLSCYLTLRPADP